MITFNVVFTPGTARRLLPFALTLLQGSGVAVRLVANGCAPGEVEQLRSAARVDDRLEHHVVAPAPAPVEHGLALNLLFEAFPEPHFAIADSDVLASGDFMASLDPTTPAATAVFSGTPVWAGAADCVLPADARILTGRARELHDGTVIGGTYVAVYERQALAPVWKTAPRGFGVHHAHMLPRALRAELRRRGWDHGILDTGRLLNLQLLLAGCTLANRAVPELHHVGGLSGGGFGGMRGLVQALPRMLREPELRRPSHVADVLLQKRAARARRRDPRFRQIEARRRMIRSHVTAVLDALDAGRPLPPAPRTDSPEVDSRVAALVAALETHYPDARARLVCAEAIPA